MRKRLKRLVALLSGIVLVVLVCGAFAIWRWWKQVDRDAASVGPPLVFFSRTINYDRFAGDVARTAETSRAYPELSAKGRAALVVLANAREFSGCFDDRRVEYPNTRAFNTLLYEPMASAAFAELTSSATAFGKLYGLCGLYFVDRDALARVMPQFASDMTPIETHFSDVIIPIPLSELVGDPPILAPPDLRKAPLETIPPFTVAAGGLCIAICRPPCNPQQPNNPLQPADLPGTPPAKQASRQSVGG